jgi:hypothetical protein
VPDILSTVEEEIEKQLDAKAAKSNLTVANVKNILKVCTCRYLVSYEYKYLQPCDRHVLIQVL